MPHLTPRAAAFVLSLVVPALALAQTPAAVDAEAERKIEEVLRQVVTWRRDFHQHPELGLQETRTSKIVADHPRTLGLTVQDGVPGAPTAVVTVGKFTAGNRSNIIPDTAELVGTIRAFDEGERKKIQQRVQAIATNYAEAPGATAKVTFGLGYPVTRNDPALTERMVPTLKRVAGDTQVKAGSLTGTAEDFSYFPQDVPGLFFFLGVTPSSQDPAKAALNHSPHFCADESALPVGVRAMTHLEIDYLFDAATPAPRP